MLISQTGRKSKNVFVIRALDVRLVSGAGQGRCALVKAVLEGLDLPVSLDRSAPS